MVPTRALRLFRTPKRACGRQRRSGDAVNGCRRSCSSSWWSKRTLFDGSALLRLGFGLRVFEAREERQVFPPSAIPSSCRVTEGEIAAPPFATCNTASAISLNHELFVRKPVAPRRIARNASSGSSLEDIAMISAIGRRARVAAMSSRPFSPSKSISATRTSKLAVPISLRASRMLPVWAMSRTRGSARSSCVSTWRKPGSSTTNKTRTGSVA